uniref:Fibronectin type-III domain-containing protein n=1 Tax=Oryzias latipes TaxID=8090 RepID=A0A3P9LKY1_ORYLA
MAVNQSGRSVPRESKPIVVRDSTSLPEFDLRGVCKKTVIAKAGSDIKIEIPVFGRPRPTISWQKNNTALKLTQRINVETTAATAVLNISECTRDDSGVYTILGKNIVGSVTDNIIVKVHDVPGPPKGPIQIVEISRTFCMFSWETPENNGGVPITNYVVEIRETTSQTWTELSSTVIRTMVLAENEYGIGLPIESIESVKVSEKPHSPKNVEVSEIKKDSMVLNWETPSETGGSPIIGYIIEKHDKEGVRWTRCNRQTVIGLTFKVTGLLESHIYEFRVAAENAVGIGEPSSPTVFHKAI